MNICFDKYGDNNKDNDNDKEATTVASNNEIKEVVGNINTNENTTTGINTSLLSSFLNDNNHRVLSTSPSLPLTLVYNVKSSPAFTLVTGLTKILMTSEFGGLCPQSLECINAIVTIDFYILKDKVGSLLL